MSREIDFRTRMLADATLMATLTGGVHAKQNTGREGITRDTTPSAYASGWLRPCALVHQRTRVADGVIQDMESRATSVIQVVEVYIYQDNAYDQIDIAVNRIYRLFQGHRFSDTSDIAIANVIERGSDDGVAMGAKLARLDWAVSSVWIAA